MGYRVAEKLDDALERKNPCVLVQGANGMAVYATLAEEKNFFTDEDMIVVFPISETDHTEFSLKPDEYGKTWRCIVPEEDYEPFEIGMKFPFIGGKK